MSIPIPEAPMGWGWADIYMVKGVFVRFGFDLLELRNFLLIVKQSNAERNRLSML